MGLMERFFPRYHLKRELARLRLDNVKRAYEAGKPTDFYKNIFGIGGSSPNLDMQRSGELMRYKARYLDENLDLVTGLFDTLELRVVGNSNPIRPLVRNMDGTLNEDVNKKLLDYWAEWGRSPTTNGEYSLNKALKLACRSWLRDGEFLTRIKRGRNPRQKSKIPLSLELIEADYLPYNKERKRKSGKSAIIQGVEFNRFSQPTAYHLYEERPDESLFSTHNFETRRIPADQVYHLKFVKRAGQVRGVTLLHGVINRLEDLKDYEESERIAARVAAALTGYIKKPGEGMGKVEGTDRKLEMSPGMIFDNLLPGEEIGMISSDRPNTQLVDYRQAMLQAVAAGTRSNSSTISRNYDGTYSSQRQELLEAMPAYEGLRIDFVDQYLGPIWREFIQMGLVVGIFSFDNIDPRTIDCIGTVGIDIGWIDPQKQANAIDTSIKAGITSRGQVIRDSGGDPLAVFSEIKEEEKIFGPLNPEPVAENSDQGATENEEGGKDASE